MRRGSSYHHHRPLGQNQARQRQSRPIWQILLRPRNRYLQALVEFALPETPGGAHILQRCGTRVCWR